MTQIDFLAHFDRKSHRGDLVSVQVPPVGLDVNFFQFDRMTILFCFISFRLIASWKKKKKRMHPAVRMHPRGAISAPRGESTRTPRPTLSSPV